jgi:hypothetical protein
MPTRSGTIPSGNSNFTTTNLDETILGNAGYGYMSTSGSTSCVYVNNPLTNIPLNTPLTDGTSNRFYVEQYLGGLSGSGFNGKYTKIPIDEAIIKPSLSKFFQRSWRSNSEIDNLVEMIIETHSHKSLKFSFLTQNDRMQQGAILENGVPKLLYSPYLLISFKDGEILIGTDDGNMISVESSNHIKFDIESNEIKSSASRSLLKTDDYRQIASHILTAVYWEPPKFEKIYK